MGFFSYAYVINGTESKDCITLSITAFKATGPALFSWGPGTRPPGLASIADGTLFCAEQLQMLPGYPRLDHRTANGGASLNKLCIEESFSPMKPQEPVLFHVILPPRFVIKPDLTPFTLDSNAKIAVSGDRLFFAWPKVGGGDLKFWIVRLPEKESFADYDLNRLVIAPGNGMPKVSFELNLGVAKMTIG